jgi:hypothetical protein
MMGTPNPAANAELVAVSCPGLKSCFAVGSYFLQNDAQHTLVEHWNGHGTWTVMTGTPSPSGIDDLSGLSCPATKSCFAVGDADNPVPYSFVERWNGHGGWSMMSAPRRSTNNNAFGESCPTTASCFAVGGDGTNNWVEHWNGTGSWEVMNSPNPLKSWLVGVACPSPTSCLAVGQRLRYREHYRTLIERYA